MKISYKSDKVRKICESESIAQKKLGKDGAKTLRARVIDLKAAQFVSDLIAGNPHPLKVDRKEQFALNLADGKRLIFTPDHGDQVPKSTDDSIDWQKVTDIRIEEIVDYHHG